MNKIWREMVMTKLINFIKSRFYKNKNEVKKVKEILKNLRNNRIIDAHKQVIDLMKSIERKFVEIEYKKVIININSYGFGLSEQALNKLSELKKEEIDEATQFNVARDDKDLVSVVETMGLGANDNYSKLAIVKIPHGIDYEIKNKNGNEHIYIYGQNYTKKLLN
jgi:hypothetical protein